MTLREIEDRLRGVSFDDAFVQGIYEDEGALSEVILLPSHWYFKFASSWVEFAAIDREVTMQVRLVDFIARRPGLDDEMIPVLVSMRDHVLAYPYGNRAVAAVRFWNYRDLDGVVGCDAARFDLVNGQKIFLDPTIIDGIRVGDESQEQRWQRDWPNAVGAPETVVSLLP